jgi:siderophore synthetase component
MRTLGRANLRLIQRRTLPDGALIGRLLRQVQAREPRFAHAVIVADESTWLHAGHPLLAVLIRRWDADVAAADLVPVAALTAIGPSGRPVITALADGYYDGDLRSFLDAYLRALLDWNVTLWLRYGIVLEAHPQNALIAVDRSSTGPRLRLLVRDLDSCVLDLDVLAGALGPAAPTSDDLADQRLVVGQPAELAALFITTTLHQCVAAVLIETAVLLGRDARPLLDLIRPLLSAAAEQHPEARDTGLLISGIVKADRLPVKCALTAATLLPKSRTGAADVNKFYGADAPSYL